MENCLKEKKNLKFKWLSLHHRNITFKSSSENEWGKTAKRKISTCEREGDEKYERITKSLKINIIKKELYQVEQQQNEEESILMSLFSPSSPALTHSLFYSLAPRIIFLTQYRSDNAQHSQPQGKTKRMARKKNMKGKCVHKKNVDKQKKERERLWERERERARSEWVVVVAKILIWVAGRKTRLKKIQRKVKWERERERRCIGKLRNIKNKN
jgi:hypothetical protein